MVSIEIEIKTNGQNANSIPEVHKRPQQRVDRPSAMIHKPGKLGIPKDRTASKGDS